MREHGTPEEISWWEDRQQIDRDRKPAVPPQREGYEARNGSIKTSTVDDKQQVRVRGEAILTAIDKSVVVLLKGLGPISFPLEENSSDTL